MCSLVFFFFFLINTTLIIGEMTVESLIKNAWNLISVLSQRKQQYHAVKQVLQEYT